MKIILNDTLKKMGVSQYKLSQQTDIAASTLNNLCNGKTSRIEFAVLDKICDALNCNVDSILTHDKGDTTQ